MESNNTYDDIVNEYLDCKSVTRTAKKLHVSEERVRRTLITEGLWTSKSAEPIVKMYYEGISVPEIAEALRISEKTVQSYIPYSRGMYGGERSDTAIRSDEYRNRMRKADKDMVGRDDYDMVSEESIPDRMIEINERPADYKSGGFSMSKKNEKSNRLDKNTQYVYQLHFDLTSGFYSGADDHYNMKDEEREDFLKLAKARDGISRTVLVPGDMNLHAMHYMLLKLFGWQNEHLHRFSLPEGIFKELTNDKIGKWMDLCGSLFRFPTDDNSDLYWDDDYKSDESVRSWLRGKYCFSYVNKIISESLIDTLSEIRLFKERFMSDGSRFNQKLTYDSTFIELDEVVKIEDSPNSVLERLRICDLLLCTSEINDSWKDEWNNKTATSLAEKKAEYEVLCRMKKYKKELDESIDELRKWRSFASDLDSALYYRDRKEIDRIIGRKPEDALREAEKVILALEDDVFSVLNDFDPEMYPFTDTLYYLYDYGDGWCIRIKCEKRYKEVEGSFTDEENNEITGTEYNRLLGVLDDKIPVCIASDGLSLVEDVGGIWGFYEMLKTLDGDDPDEKKSMKEWARSLGWTGRMSKPENML